MSPRSEAMETPNTRSRRKRELNEEDEGGRVSWGHDQRLRRQIMENVAGQAIHQPSPTQAPAFSRPPAPPPADSSSNPVPKPARRRPCRAHRSLPSQLSHSTTDPNSKRANSVPTPQNDELGDLLAQAAITLFVQPTASSGKGAGFERHLSSGSGTSASSGSWVLPKIETAEPVEMTTMPPPAPLPPTPVRPALTSKPIPRNTARTPAVRETPYTKPPPPPPNSVTTAPSIPSKPVPTKSPASRGVPRVGLSSRPKQAPTSTTNTASTRPSGSQQRFKPPFLAQQTPIRCSPRRHPQPQHPSVAQQTPSKLRAGAITASRAAPAAPAEKAEGKTKDAPSSDSVGDESFDSFDGIFEAGGEDIEALLNMGAS